MKKLVYAIACTLAVASCNQDAVKKAEQNAQHQRDSLEQIISQKDNEINDMMTTLSDIEEGFREITEAQSRVTLAKQGEGTNTMQRIKENIQFIQSAMQQNKELINKLKQQVRESSVKGTQLKKIIDNLTQQLETKDQQLQALREELDKKDIHISELDEQVASLNTDVSNLQEDNSKKEQTINSQDKALHTAWFVFGTRKELMEQKVLSKDGFFSKTKILNQDFNKDYFTKIDIRIDKEIKLYSKSAEIMTSHPVGSYTLQPDANKQYVLRITNPEAFWSTSKYLVVLVK
jgi:DNA repair exonuclease SbcCD ATPase subunit